MSNLIVGVDEAGRGPLAGPVVAAAVILPLDNVIDDLKDSKLLTPTKREALAELVQEKAVDFSIALATVEEIDSLNIHHATLLAMSRAIDGLKTVYDAIYIDGKFVPEQVKHCAQAFVKGDQKYPCISAASILAKTHRDQYMVACHHQYPNYAFNSHKGYPTKEHIHALREHGATPIHRKSYKPVRDCLESQLEGQL